MNQVESIFKIWVVKLLLDHFVVHYLCSIGNALSVVLSGLEYFTADLIRSKYLNREAFTHFGRRCVYNSNRSVYSTFSM